MPTRVYEVSMPAVVVVVVHAHVTQVNQKVELDLAHVIQYELF